MLPIKIQGFGGVVLVIVGIVVLVSTRSQLSSAREENKNLERKAVVTIKTHKVETIENNQSIIFKKEKEVKVEEVPSAIGTHTISID